MSKEIKRYYKNYSNTEHNYSNILTDQQYMFVDYCMGQVIVDVGKKLYESGEFPHWDEEYCINEVNEALGGCEYDFWNPENYEAWYDKDENTVIANIYEALDELCADYADLVREAYSEEGEAC